MITIALVPAKGRSVGLPGKNGIDLCGKPLLAWTVEAAREVASVAGVFVSTEDDRLGALSRKCGAEVLPRPLALCDDATTTDEVIADALPLIREKTGESEVLIVLLQVTSPLRTGKDIEQALDLFHRTSPAAVVSVYEEDNAILKSYMVTAEGYLTGAFSPDAPYTPRQFLPKVYRPNGAIYIFPAAEFERSGGIPRNRVMPYVMEKSRSIDIDSADDLAAARHFLETRHAHAP